MLLVLLGEKAVRVPGVVRVEGQCRDPKDDPILACAVEGRASHLVTGDDDLLELDTYEGIRIVSPADFLKLVEEPEA
jgi:predicted nucleic acid-binding protein